MSPFITLKGKTNMKEKYGVIGCGWLGLPMAKKWLDEGKKVIGTTTNKTKVTSLQELGIHSYLVQNKVVENDQKWLSELDYVLLNIPPSSLQENYSSFMLEICSFLKPGAKVIFISSTSVYGMHNQWAKEDDVLDGNRRNSKFVIKAEQELRKLLNDQLTVIRMAGLIGNGRHPIKFLSGKNVKGGKEPVNLIHINDCIQIIDRVILTSSWGETFNASSPHHPTKEKYYEFMAKENAAPAGGQGLPLPHFDHQPQAYKFIDVDKLRNELSYTFAVEDLFSFSKI